MPFTTSDLDRFHTFARHHLQNGGAELTLDELVDMWQATDLSPEELAESVAAVRAALQDLHAGDRGVSADEHVRMLREKYHLAEHADGL